jgi:hypothetical protein
LAALSLSELSFSNFDKGTGIENRWSASYSRADPRLEVAPDPSLYVLRAPISLELLQIQPQALDPLPEVRVIDPAAVGIEGVSHLEETTLPGGRLSGSVQHRRAWVLAGERKVAEDEPPRLLLQAPPNAGAARAAEIGVDD